MNNVAGLSQSTSTSLISMKLSGLNYHFKKLTAVLKQISEEKLTTTPKVHFYKKKQPIQSHSLKFCYMWSQQQQLQQ